LRILPEDEVDVGVEERCGSGNICDSMRDTAAEKVNEGLTEDRAGGVVDVTKMTSASWLRVELRAFVIMTGLRSSVFFFDAHFKLEDFMSPANLALYLRLRPQLLPALLSVGECMELTDMSCC
jgi:hypothetical protein